MPRHRVSVTFSLSTKQVELLDRLAQRTNVPKSVYVRKGLDVILRRYRDCLSLRCVQLSLLAGRRRVDSRD
jgi:hypothetical protein